MWQMSWKYTVFMTFLAAAAWQDLRRKSVSVWLYIGYGVIAGVIRAVGGDGVEMDLSGLPVGLALLAAGRLTGGAIGSGDGCFFVISGLYLSLQDNICLLLYGILLGGLFCLILFLRGKKRGKNMGRTTVPFLPFLVPAWIWMVFL